ncbi:MAG: hypothetical protein PHV39_06650, partial [Methanomicrobium sp.]|nr:hypothetical protein [Methanomicrobium sp.]
GEKNGTESSVGYLPMGESLTIFEPAEIKYSGSTTLIEAEANYNKKINESSYENNSFEVIIENPLSNSNSESSFGITTKNNEQKSDNSCSDTVLNNNQYSETCPVQQGCSDICFICGVVGLLSILLCVLSFTLGYFYGLNKNCEREVRWMRSKIDLLRNDEKSEKTEDKSKNDNIAEEMEEKLERAIEELKENKD